MALMQIHDILKHISFLDVVHHLLCN